MERIPLHSCKMGHFIKYHVTISSQLNNQNLIRYYIKLLNSFNLIHGLIFGVKNFVSQFRENKFASSIN